jgi:prohibitin 2
MRVLTSSILVLSFLVVVVLNKGCTIVSPGNRGVKVHLGEVSQNAVPEGLVWHLPLVTDIKEVVVRQQTKGMDAECYSVDLQQINVKLKVLYRIPENQVVTLFQKYSGDPFDSLVAPRVAEALKEVTALQTAEGIVKSREKIKIAALAAAKAKIGDLVFVEDVVIENVALSKELEASIEAKMVQQQEAAKAEFTKEKAIIDAKTALITAEGQAKAISVRGAAIRDNPGLVELQIVEKWDGKVPQVVGGVGGANMLLPLKDKQDK